MENSTTASPPAEKLPDPAAEKVRFKGAAIEVGDRVLVVPALSCRSAIDLSPKFDELEKLREAGISTRDWLSLVFDIVMPAVARNYPTMTREELEELVDMSNANQFFMAAIGKLAQLNPATW